MTLQRALEKGELLARMERLRRGATRDGALSRILGNSEEVQRVIGQIEKVADSLLTVLIQGETGTGKETGGPGAACGKLPA